MSTATGRAAEGAAADYLRGKDFGILAQNWRTRWCEIDIVAIKNDIIYFVEVKYRKNEAWGSGLEYITSHKLQHMQLAAQFWCASHRVEDYRLSAIELTDDPPLVSQFVQSIE